MNRNVLIALAALVVIVIAVGGWFYYSGQGIGVTTAPGAQGGVPVIAADEKFIGKADAPVTIVEYFSLGCPHCRTFHETVLPTLKTEYLDTGKARIVFRDFPLDGVSFAAAALTRCVNDLAYFPMVDALFAQQDAWHVEGGVVQIANIAKGAGMDQAAFDACIKDETRNAKILAIQKEASDVYKVDSTPTMLVNGKKLATAGEYEPLKKAIDEALANQ